jgi:hypothetical protein
MTTGKNLAAAAIIAAFLAAGGWIAAGTFGTTGRDAVEKMSADERAVLVKLKSLRRGMSYDQVTAIMGAPDDTGPLGMRPKWLVGGSQLNAVVVYILPGGAHRFTWISIGRFTYNEELRKASEREG